jgi:hypothetical protein
MQDSVISRLKLQFLQALLFALSHIYQQSIKHVQLLIYTVHQQQ